MRRLLPLLWTWWLVSCASTHPVSGDRSCHGTDRGSPDVQARIRRSTELSKRGDWAKAHAELGSNDSFSATDRALLTLERARLEADQNFFIRHDPIATQVALDHAAELVDESGGCVPALQLLHLRGRFAFAEKLMGVGEWSSPERFFTDAHALADAIDDRTLSTDSTFYLGLLEQFQSRKGAARALFEQARDQSITAHDQIEQSYAERHLASLDEEAGELGLAEEGYRKSLQLRRESGFQLGEGPALEALGELVGKRGRTDEAIQLLEEAVGASVRVSGWRSASDAELGLATLLKAKGDRDQSLVHARNAADFASRFGDPEARNAAEKLLREAAPATPL